MNAGNDQAPPVIGSALLVVTSCGPGRPDRHGRDLLSAGSAC